MNEKTWLALFDLIHYAIDNAIPILTAISALAATIFSILNRAHLARQDIKLNDVGNKVDGQVTAMVDATKKETDRMVDATKVQTDKLAESVAHQTDQNAETLKAEIARLHDKLEAMAVTPSAPSVSSVAVIIPDGVKVATPIDHAIDRVTDH